MNEPAGKLPRVGEDRREIRAWRDFFVDLGADPDRETPCPVRYDKTHSSEWWDGGTCTACGES